MHEEVPQSLGLVIRERSDSQPGGAVSPPETTSLSSVVTLKPGTAA